MNTSTNLAVVEADAVIISMTRASLALVEAQTIQQTKKILDVAAAAEIYARRQKLGEQAEDMAASIKVEALRKLGEMLQATPRAKGEILRGTKMAPRENQAQTLADLGLTKKESAVAQKLAAMPEKDFQQVRDGHVTVSKALAAVDAAKAKPTVATPRTQPDTAPSAAVVTPTEPADIGAGDLLEELQADVERLTADVAALSADDTKAELLKVRRQLDHAQRQQSEAMDRAKQATDREVWAMRQLRRCGKAVGQEDPTKTAAAVEAMARDGMKAAA